MAAARHLILSCPPPLSGVYLVGNESRQGLDVGVAEFQCKSNLLTAGIYTCFLDSVKRRFQVPAEMALTPCASGKCHRVPQDILFIFSKKQSRWGCLPHTKALHRTCCVHVWEFCLVCVCARGWGIVMQIETTLPPSPPSFVTFFLLGRKSRI